MRLIGSRDVLKLTGLTSDQLREWTVRRGLICADLPSARQGQQAQFAWQTVLVLRLMVVMSRRFHIELQVHRDLFVRARELLNGRSFPGLWGNRIAVFGLERCALLGADDPVPTDQDALLLLLNDHLEALSQGFGVAEPIAQLPLFPAIGLRRGETLGDVEENSGPRTARGDVL